MSKKNMYLTAALAVLTVLFVLMLIPATRLSAGVGVFAALVTIIAWLYTREAPINGYIEIKNGEVTDVSVDENVDLSKDNVLIFKVKRKE